MATGEPGGILATMASAAVPDKSLTGQVAVVTGSSRGIGRAIALALAEAGANVLVHCRRSRALAEQVAAEVSKHGCCGGILIADLAAPEACDRLIDDALADHGQIDIWVNNAGADVLTGQAAALNFDEKLELLWRVDVRAAIRLSRRIGARMKQAGGGVILNVGWDQADTGMGGDSGELFAATKGAVMAFSRSLAVSLAPEVRVNCLAPGWTRTAWGEQASDAWQKRAVDETPLGRWGAPEDVAAVARFLVSPAAAFVTGQSVRINGGAVRG